MYPTHDADALLMLAATLATKRRPAELVEVIAAFDLLQEPVPSTGRLIDSIQRLSAHGLLCEVDGGLALSAEGQLLMAALPKERHGFREFRRTQLDETVGEAAQEVALAHGDAGDVFAEQMAAGQHAQRLVAGRVVGHRGHDADAEAEFHVGLDHVGIEGRHDDVGREAGRGKGFVDPGAAREAFVIGDDRVLGNGFQGQRFDGFERMPGRHDHRVVPAVILERYAVAHAGDAFGGDADVGAAILQHRDDFRRAGLVQHQVHFREFLLEARHHLRQRIAGLGVRGGDGELAVVAGC
jgi:hypothetical protein